MEYISVKEAAKRWGVDTSRIGRLAREGRIPGAKIVGRNWLIPEDAKKPTDKRTKREREFPSTTPFRFPLFVNFSENSFTPPLSPEERTLKEAQTDFYDCEFERAEKALVPLAESAENIYVKICALFYLCVLSVVNHAKSGLQLCYEKMVHQLSLDFPHKHEMALFLPWFDFTVAKFRDVAGKMKDEPCEYHSSCTYLVAFLSIFKLTDSDINSADTGILEPYKILCQLAERDGYLVEAQKLHNILFLAYYSLHDEEALRYHLKKALDIAYQYHLIYPMADAIGYYADEIEPMLADYPAPFGEKIRTAGKRIAENFGSFAKKSDSAIYSKLSSNEYRFLIYATKRYSNKQVANLCGISERTVANRYNDIYNKLGVNSKQELVREIEKDMSKKKKPDLA